VSIGGTARLTRRPADGVSTTAGMRTSTAPPRRLALFALCLVAAFGFRLAFGLLSEFWADDERNLYLLGLKYYSTGLWPYFGPDVVYTQSQIPGALQALLVALPLKLLAIPEAPYVLLNALSFAGLLLFGWYVRRRTPGVPAWFVWGWLFLCPWTLNYSTHIINPSYVLAGSLVFFVGVFERLPGIGLGIVDRRLTLFLVGFGFLWIAQLHMSYPLLAPFVALVLYFEWRRGWTMAATALAWILAGALVAGSTLLPTLLVYGFRYPADQTALHVQVLASRLLELPIVVARFLSFASFEVPRFFGNNTASRLEFLGRVWWAAPFAVLAGLLGIAQALGLAWLLVKPRWAGPAWAAARKLALLTLALIYVSFVFSVKGPASHAFYLSLPVATLFAFFCWEPLFARAAWRRLAAALLLCGLVVHAGLMAGRAHTASLYRDRATVQRAITEKNYRIIGERRAEQWGCLY
jgi:hypothetical protein